MPPPTTPPPPLQFGKYLLEKQRPEWAEFYVDYKGLKDLIKESAEDADKVRRAAGREGREEEEEHGRQGAQRVLPSLSPSLPSSRRVAAGGRRVSVYPCLPSAAASAPASG